MSLKAGGEPPHLFQHQEGKTLSYPLNPFFPDIASIRTAATAVKASLREWQNHITSSPAMRGRIIVSNGGHIRLLGKGENKRFSCASCSLPERNHKNIESSCEEKAEIDQAPCSGKIYQLHISWVAYQIDT